MDKPYGAWCEAFSKCKTEKERLALCERTEKGEFGEEVKWSLFGIGTLSTFELSRETVKSMRFYAKLE